MRMNEVDLKHERDDVRDVAALVASNATEQMGRLRQGQAQIIGICVAIASILGTVVAIFGWFFNWGFTVQTDHNTITTNTERIKVLETSVGKVQGEVHDLWSVVVPESVKKRREQTDALRNRN